MILPVDNTVVTYESPNIADFYRKISEYTGYDRTRRFKTVFRDRDALNDLPKAIGDAKGGLDRSG